MATNTPIAKIKSIDHVVLTVADIDATVKWYQKFLGMKHETFETKSETRHALICGNQKINLHKSGFEFEPKAQNVQPGSGDLCFISETPVNSVLSELRKNNVTVLEGGGVVDRTGAVGKLKSVYFRDPDGNLIE